MFKPGSRNCTRAAIHPGFCDSNSFKPRQTAETINCNQNNNAVAVGKMKDSDLVSKTDKIW